MRDLLAIVSGKLNTSLSTVIGHLDCSHKVSELDVVLVGVQPVRRHLQDVEQLAGG